MIFVLILFVFIPIAILLALGWLIVRPLPEEKALKFDVRMEDLRPLHTQRFPQLRQSLAEKDSLYVRRKIPEAERLWRKERRKILRSFLAGLADDFARMDRLARTTASLSPKFSRRQELERIWLSMRFRVNYRIASLKFAVGGFHSIKQLARLTELMGSLAARTEAAMAQLEIPPSGTGPLFGS